MPPPTWHEFGVRITTDIGAPRYGPVKCLLSRAPIAVSYGRMPIKVTRTLLTAALDGSLKNAEWSVQSLGRKKTYWYSSTNCHDANPSSSAFASLRSRVSKPSVNQP